MNPTILNVAYPFAPVGVDSCGGAEQIVSLLDRALTREGWRSVVVARADSRVCGTLVGSGIPNGEVSAHSRQQIWEDYRKIVAQAIQDYRPDVIHMHGVDFDSYLPSLDRPILVTLHLPLTWYPKELFTNESHNLVLQCVSEAQRRTCPAPACRLLVIENGIDVDQFRLRPVKRNFALALGRICPEKGFHLALDAAHRANIPMLLAGQVFPYPEHERHFRDEILPRIGERNRFLGAVGFNRKRRLLESARCIVIPSLVSETSSLVAMESLACGTPVVASTQGALPEIIEDGKTGFLASDESEMADAIAHVPELSPQLCRERACERFQASRMVAQYMALYRELAGTPHSMRPSVPPCNTREPPLVSHPRRGRAQLEIEEITSLDALAQVVPDWRELYGRCPGATPFQLPDWLIPWWQHFGRGQPCVLALREKGNLVGIVPLMFHEHMSRPIRQVSWWGAGVSDYQGPLLDPAWARAGSEAILGFLSECADRWKFADLQGLRADSPLLTAAGNNQLRYRIYVDDVCPALSLPASAQDLEASLGGQFRKNLRRSRKHFESEGWSIATSPPESTKFTKFLEVLFRLHGDRWRQKGYPGVLSDPNVQSFHRSVASALIGAGSLWLQLLQREASVASAIYWMTGNGRAYFYIGAFSPEYQRLSPGSVLLWYALEQAIAQGCHELDFLRGAEAYKYSWGAKDQRLYRLALTHA